MNPVALRPIPLTEGEVLALRQRADVSESLFEFCSRIALVAIQREVSAGLKKLEAQELIESGSIAVNADPDAVLTPTEGD